MRKYAYTVTVILLLVIAMTAHGFRLSPTGGGSLLAPQIFAYVNQLVGLSTSTPTGQFAIELDNSVVDATTPVFTVSDEGTSTPFMTINYAGNVGIATSSPSHPLDIGDGSATGTAVIRGGASVGGELILKDSDGDGCTMITVNNGNIQAGDVTCPL